MTESAESTQKTERTRWYKDAVVYQIYPYSFMDSNNDGMGDINGIISKLDYVKDLGVTAIWFSPLYKTAYKDYGYDVSDYCAINPDLGTMEDFDRLLAKCHKRGLKVIMDMVVNHTSTEHEWFKKAMSDPSSPYRDYYIIRKGKREGDKLLPPTNWHSTFTGSAWERIPDTDDFYLHLFCVEQADLNWENPAVRREVKDILRFWLDKGVDGFRFDVFNLFSKVQPIADDPAGHDTCSQYVDGPRMHEFLKELYTDVLSKYDSYTVGESFMPDRQHALDYSKESNGELDTIFNFSHFGSDNRLKFMKRRFDLRIFKDGLFTSQLDNFGQGWNTLVLENHDSSRSNSRFGINTQKYRYESSTFLPTVTFLGFGTPFLYMGQEIGMTNADFGDMEDFKDPVSHFVYDLLRSRHVPKRIAFRFVRYGARDYSRVPMQWSAEVNAGFNTGAKPWQRTNANYPEINVEKDLASGRSIYRFYQKLLKLKRETPLFVHGAVREYDHDNKRVIAYTRTLDGASVLVAGNFSNRPVTYALPPELKGKYTNVLLSNYEDSAAGDVLRLRPYEAVVLQ